MTDTDLDVVDVIVDPPAAKTAREIRDDLLELARRVNGLIPADMPSVEFRANSDGTLDVNPYGSDDPGLGKRLAELLGLAPKPPYMSSAGVCFEWVGYVGGFPIDLTIYSRSAVLHQDATCSCGQIHTGGVDAHGQPL